MCIAFAEPSDVEFVQHRVKGRQNDLVRQKLTGNQAERCTAMSEGDVETGYIVDAPRTVPSPGTGLVPIPHPAVRASACLARPAKPRQAGIGDRRRYPYLPSAVRMMWTLAQSESTANPPSGVGRRETRGVLRTVRSGWCTGRVVTRRDRRGIRDGDTKISSHGWYGGTGSQDHSV